MEARLDAPVVLIVGAGVVGGQCVAEVRGVRSWSGVDAGPEVCGGVAAGTPGRGSPCRLVQVREHDVRASCGVADTRGVNWVPGRFVFATPTVEPLREDDQPANRSPFARPSNLRAEPTSG